MTVVFWRLLDNNVFDIDPNHNAYERHAMGVLKLRSVLFSWYDQRKRLNPHEDLQAMKELTAKMLGTRMHPKLRSKAAETKGLLFFSVDMLAKFCHRLPFGDALLGAGKALEKYVVTCASHGRNLAPSTIQDCWRFLKRGRKIERQARRRGF